ncbi:MAG: SOS response-associated peptidase [Magnetococcales bacterium]|nr:SOS response-associated peptidase [Magnetococcales bacterium]
MCGRFAQLNGFSEIVMTAGARVPLEFLPRYNIAPSQKVPVVRRVTGFDVPVVDELLWGLIPFWAKSADIGGRLINARSESVTLKPAFRSAYKARRCLIPVDGFYEWKRDGVGGKCPYYIGMADKRPFALGGLWESWKGSDGSVVETFTVLTTEPNEIMKPIHKRMPLIIDHNNFNIWLDNEVCKTSAIDKLLSPYQAQDMQAIVVNSFVNNARNEGPGCIAPPEEDRQLSLF